MSQTFFRKISALSTANTALALLMISISACSSQSLPISSITIPTRTLYFSNQQLLAHWDQNQLQLIANNQLYQAQLTRHELSQISSQALSNQPVRELQQFSPDGKQLLTLTSTQEDLQQANAGNAPQLQQRIQLSDPNGQNSRELDAIKGRVQHIKWSASGQTLAYTSEPLLNLSVSPHLLKNQRSQLHIHKLNSAETTKVLSLPLPEGAPAESNLKILSLAWYPVQGSTAAQPDRELLLLVETQHSNPFYNQKQLLKLDLSSSSFSSILVQKTISESFATATTIGLSADGKDIYFLNGEPDFPVLFKVINPDPQNTENLVEPIQANSLPVWSPDGRFMATIKISQNAQQDLQLCNSLGRDCYALTQTPDLQESQPIWSPDSKQLAFTVLKSLDQKDALGFYTLTVDPKGSPRQFNGQIGLKTQSKQVAMKTYSDTSNTLIDNKQPFALPDSFKD